MSLSNYTQVNQVISQISAVDTKDGAMIYYEIDNQLLSKEMFIVLRYVNQEDFINKRNVKWNYISQSISGDNVILVDDLESNEKYFYSLGLSVGDGEQDFLTIENWSGLHSFESDARWSIENGVYLHLLSLLGALGLFIYGMKTLSDGMQKGTGPLLRRLIGGMTSNKSNGIFYGFLTTAIVQSSSAITVMVVSFVNTGILTLKQSIAVIAGANIGTTVTAWLIAILGFQSYMPEYALVLFLIAIVLLFSGRPNYSSWGETLVGFALLFFGLEFLKNGIPDVRVTLEQFEFLEIIADTTVFSVLLATIIGAVLTIILQSSIAAIALTILLSARGVLPYEMALGMVIGSNIGTTITANIAAISGNVHAKRAARSHLLFNFVGLLWAIFLFPYIIVFIDLIFDLLFNLPSPVSNQTSRPIAIAVFHTLFNLVNSVIIFYFIDLIAGLVVKLVPSYSEDDEVFQFGYIKAGMLSTPELTIIEAKKEIAKYGKITSRMSSFFQKLLNETDKKKKQELYARIEKYEGITDRVEIEITNYLSETSKNDISIDTSDKVRGMMAVANYLERIGDVFFQMSITLKRKEKSKIWFSPEQRESLLKMLIMIDEAFEVMVFNLSANYEEVNFQKAFDVEKKINDYRDYLRKQHFENVEKREYNVKSGIIYSDLFFSCEKIGDHIFSVTEAIMNENEVELFFKRLNK